MQAAGRVVLHKCSTHLCVAVYEPCYRITHCLQRCKNTLQITALCRLKTLADWLKQGSEGMKATWQPSQRPHMVMVTSAAVE